MVSLRVGGEFLLKKMMTSGNLSFDSRHFDILGDLTLFMHFLLEKL